jgi:hypothetical protein
MAKMKFDIKQFVMQKGERVGLGVAVGLMALLGLWSVLGALGAKSPAKEIASAADDLTRKVNSGGGEIDQPVALPEVKEWVAGVNPDGLKMVPLFDPNAAGNPKRSSPLVLPPDYRVVDNKYPVMAAQMDVVFLGYKSFDVLGENVYYLKPKGGGQGVGFTGGKGGMVGPGPGGKSAPGGGMVGPGPGGLKGGGRPGTPFGKGGSSDDKKYKEILVPLHAVVVSGSFAIKDQLEMIRKALRYNSIEELFNSGNGDAMPEFAGLVVLRREFAKDGKPGEWADLKLDDPNGPTMKLYALCRGFEPEDEEQQQHMFPGLVMPRPWSLTTHYPLIDLKDIPKGEPKKEVVAGARQQPGILGPGGMFGPGGPGGAGGQGGAGGPGGGGPGGRFGPGGGIGQANQVVHYDAFNQSIKGLPETYDGPESATQDKFNRKFDIFEPGGFPHEEGEIPAPGNINGKLPRGTDPKMGGVRPPGPGDAGGPGGPGGLPGRFQLSGQTGRLAGMSPDKQPDKALVRFVDVTVKPGHTYQYMVKVKLRNPNFKKKVHEIATSDLARKKVLESSWVFTEPVHVGAEIHFYNVDQKLLETPQDFTKKRLHGTDVNDTGKERVAVQLHRFLGEFQDRLGKKPVGDWSIAERVLVPRGEYVGHKVDVEVPVWDYEQEDFDLINGKTNPLTRQKSGTAVIDFSTRKSNVPAAVALVVDFRGGKVAYVVEQWGKNNEQPDESASEVLMLGTDGKLAVRNSRVDADPENPREVERRARLEHLRDRLNELKHPQPRATTVPGGGPGGGRG